MYTALILLAHGSRDSAWRAPFDAIATELATIQPALHVRLAFMELAAPQLADAAKELVTLGHQYIAIAPLFLGVGVHARQDIPQLVQAVQQAHTHCQWQLLPTLGENSAIQRLIAEHLAKQIKGLV